MKSKLMRRVALAVLLSPAAFVAQAQTSDLLISEYVEGSSNNKAVEIANGTGTSVDLAAGQYRLELYANGATTATATLTLTGTLAAGEVLVLCNTSADAVLSPLCDVKTSSVVNFNGDDALVLRKAGGVIDSLGQVGFDPGTAWGSGTATTLDHTLRRMAVVCSGDVDISDAFDPSVEWEGFAIGTYDGLGVDSSCSDTGGVPRLSISDTTVTEGDSGQVIALFTVALTQPAPAGGVGFSYDTADGTTTSAPDGDLPAQSGSGAIAEGETSVTFGVLVRGDTTPEPNETFLVNVGNVTGADVADAQGIGTILDDDMAQTAIHDVQGNGAMSPFAGSTVTVRGIVTGRKSNGFFLQAADADMDADPLTSEGIFVFTGSVPPAAAAVGNAVLATGTVAEYVPAADPFQLPLTELTAPAIVQLSTGNVLPTPTGLTASLPTPAGGLGQLERYEGMRVTAGSFTVVAPTRGSTSEPNATGTSNGIFNVVVTGVARPLREPGIQTPDPDPTGTTATAIPRWDFNPEMLTIDSDAIGGTQLDVPAGTVLGNVVGPLDYGFRRYTILPEAGATVSVGTLPVPTAARLPTADEFTVAGYNMERFFDTTNDPAIGEPVLTADAFERRLAKASLAIRDYLHSPDIVAVVEVENFSTLKTLADRINADAAAAPQPSFPGYVPYLSEGNDVGGIDVGFLVKTLQAGGVERVHVADVMQYGKDETWLDPSDNTQHLLNDRPPLLLTADVHFADGRVFPVDVLVVHQRSLNGADSEAADGATTEGDRVRRKRQAQAEYLANLVQSLDSGSYHLVVLGDFNAFEFNDGYADAMGTVMGTPSADNETAVNGDGADLVDPDLINLVAFEDPDQHYSFVFDGNAQSLDHVLVNERLAVDAGAIDLDHARINADFPETARNDAMSPARLSDHDPAIAYIAVASADLSVEVTAPASAKVGQALSFQATVANLGGQEARYPGVGFSFNAELAGVLVTPAAGWSCDAPQVGSGSTTIACSATSLAIAATADFTISAVPPAQSGYAVLSLAAAAESQTQDPVVDNNSDSASVAIGALSDLALTIELAASTTTDVTYRIRVSNAGPNEARAAEVLLDTNLPLGYQTFEAAVGWPCSPAGAMGTSFSCSLEEGAIASGAHADFEITVPRKLMKASYYIHGLVDSATDPNGGNNEVRRRLGMPTR